MRKKLTITEFTFHPDIYSLETYTERGITYLVINYSTHYPLNQWSIAEAIEYYLSPEGKNEREISFMKAYGFYD